jgi:hypothetical protein
MSHLIVLAVTITLGVGASNAQPAEPDFLRVIPQLLAKNKELAHHGFSSRQLEKEWVISYCPDNTCDVIRAPKRVPRKVLGEFSLLWLYYASGYVYLKRFHEVDAPPFVAEVLERHIQGCVKESEYAMASCVLTRMAVENKIRLAFRRYDEGGVFEGPNDAKAYLSEARIREVNAWQGKAWQK